MSNIAKNLAHLLQHTGLSEIELSHRIGVGQPILSRLVNGKTHSPKIDTLIKIADYFAVTVDQLIGQDTLNLSNNLSIQSLLHKGWCYVPLVEWQELSNHMKGMQNPDRRYLITDIEPDDSLYALVLRSSIMAPKVPNGAVLICSSNYNVCDGDSVVVQLPEQTLPALRQAIIDGDSIYLSTLDNANPEVIKLSPDCRVFGIVIQVRLDMINRKAEKN